MIPAKTPALVKQYYENYIWEIAESDNGIYLTFDDGPIPDVSTWILDLLDSYGIKATFFCVGDNVKKHPNTFEHLVKSGHGVGNHTFNHLNGWNTKTRKYLENIKKTTDIFKNHGIKTKLFRPPYGKLRPQQSKAIKALGYDIIFWSVLSKDYSLKLSSQQVFNNIIQHAKAGSIIVCHDNIKAFKHLKAILPHAIETLLQKGFEFKTL